MEVVILNKVTTRIQKFWGKHLSLAACIVVANSLVLSTLWYLLTLWAGDMVFLASIQKLINHFVWNGKSRVDNHTVT